MNQMLDDETLDRQLREAVPYIDDDGFTALVMNRLPAAQRRPRWLRAIVLLGLTLLGSGLACALGGRFIRNGVTQLSSLPVWLLLIFVFGCGLVMGAFAVIIALRKAPEVRDLTWLRF